MKVSEVNDILKDLFEQEGNVAILGISIIDNEIAVCYRSKQREIKVMASDYKNCDL